MISLYEANEHIKAALQSFIKPEKRSRFLLQCFCAPYGLSPNIVFPDPYYKVLHMTFFQMAPFAKATQRPDKRPFPSYYFTPSPGKLCNFSKCSSGG